jgi:hypothetical protein
MIRNDRRGPTCGPVVAFSEGRGGKAGASYAPNESRTTEGVAALSGTGRHGIDRFMVPLVVPAEKKISAAIPCGIPDGVAR